MRLDLRFFLCCCKAFLKSNSEDDQNSYYNLLGVESDASTDEIKRAYKQKSLRYHPDKLTQKGQRVTESDLKRFNGIKDAYEVLSDPRRRETYDAIGRQGLQWVENPFSIDPGDMYLNFASSSVFDRSKIYMIFVFIFAFLLATPVLICLQADEDLGDNITWAEVFIPVWILEAILFVQYIKFLHMEAERPEGVSPEDWTDPLPSKVERQKGMIRFIMKLLFEILLVLKLDDNLHCEWAYVFIPICVIEFMNLRKLRQMNLVTFISEEDYEANFEQPYSSLSQADKEKVLNEKGIFVVPTAYEVVVMNEIKKKSTSKTLEIVFRVVFLVFLTFKLEDDLDWSWWAVFIPIWISLFCMCSSCFSDFARTQDAVARASADPDQSISGTTNYSSIENTSGPGISDDEKERLQEEFQAASSKCCSDCSSLSVMMVMLCLLVGKANGAGYSSLWIISPILFICGFILCIVGCAIYCVKDWPEDPQATGRMFGGSSSGSMAADDYNPPTYQIVEPSGTIEGKVETTDLLGTNNEGGKGSDPELGQLD